MSTATLEVEIDAKQKRLAYIRSEERQLVSELDVLWDKLKLEESNGKD